MINSIKLTGLLQCINCEFITADMNLDDDKLVELYGHDYFHGEEYSNYINEKKALQMNFNYRIKELKKLSGISKMSKLLEIGCAYGYFLELIRNDFDRVCGIDVSKDAVDYGKNKLGLEVYQSNEISDVINFQPDIICMWDVIEHLIEPEKIIAQASKIISKEGYICITTGDIGSLNAKIRGKKWRMIHPPTHLHYFNKKTISLLLEENGFEVISITYPAVVRTLGMILYSVLKTRLEMHKIYDLLSKLPVQDLIIPINLFDIMFVIGKKT